MLVICYLFCVCVCRLKAQQSLCLYVVLTMPTLNKTYLFIYLDGAYLFIYICTFDLSIITMAHTILERHTNPNPSRLS
jgi:hypothetical protein